MVGVSRSTGCLPCRKAKVKCDEAKPLCGRCGKGGRPCSYADKFKFVPGKHKPTSGADVEHDAAGQTFVKPKRGVFLYTSEKRMENGDLLQKWHLSVAHPSPTHPQLLSPADIQGYHLIKCWDEGPRGMRFDLCAQWFRQLPARLGRSAALDDAASFMSEIHRLMLDNQDPAHWLCPASYIKALRSLRKAIIHPKEGYTIETMTAALILYHVEEKLGDSIYNSIRHAGGIEKLLEKRGKVAFGSGFDWEVIAQIQGPIISNCVMLGKPCFLSQPSWRDYLDGFEPETETAAIVQEFSLWLTYWPDLASCIRQLRHGALPAKMLRDKRILILQIRSRLDALEVILDEHIAQKDDIILVPTRRLDSPLAEVYDFGNASAWPALINIHCSYIMILDSMLDFIDQSGCRSHSDTAPIQQRILKADQHERLVQKVCRTYEWSTTKRPLMANMSVLALNTAYCYALTVELRDWILEALNDINDQRLNPNFRYTAETVDFINNLCIGAVDLPQSFGIQTVGSDPYGNSSDTTPSNDVELDSEE